MCEIFDKLKKSLRDNAIHTYSYLCQNNKYLDDDLDMYKLSVTSNRLENALIQTYTDSIVEMIASSYQYSGISFFILDTKFNVWKQWVEEIVAVYKHYMFNDISFERIKDIILQLTYVAKSSYEEILSNNKHKFKYNIDLIDTFLKVHEETFNRFIMNLKQSIIRKEPLSKVDILNQLQQIVFELNKWMTYTLFEILSLDRCLYGDKKIIVSRIVVNVYLENNLNLVDSIIKITGIKDVTIQFTTPELEEFRLLFDPKMQKKLEDIKYDRQQAI